MSEQLGRLEAKDMPVIHDAPSKTVSAILSKLDELIDALKACDAAANTLPTAEVAALKKIDLKL